MFNVILLSKEKMFNVLRTADSALNNKVSHSLSYINTSAHLEDSVSRINVKTSHILWLCKISLN